jgi:hypothetical protein
MCTTRQLENQSVNDTEFFGSKRSKVLIDYTRSCVNSETPISHKIKFK